MVPVLPFRVAAVGTLTADQAHPLVGGGPVLREIIEELHGIAVFKFLVVDGSALPGDKVGARAACFIHRAVIAVEHQTAALAGHAVLREGEVGFPVCRSGVLGGLTVLIELHFQVVVVARLVLNDQITAGNGAVGKLFAEFPVCGHVDPVLRAQPAGYRFGGLLQPFPGFLCQSRRAKSQHHPQRQNAGRKSFVCIVFHTVAPFFKMRHYYIDISPPSSIRKS